MKLDHLQGWVGKTEYSEDIVDVRRCSQLAGALGNHSAPKAGDVLPLPWFWTLFSPAPISSKTGEDGHPAKGLFMPPVPLPRRMWAGSQVNIQQMLRVGDKVSCESRIAKIVEKNGRQGQLVFVTIERSIYNGRREKAIFESQDIVYRDIPKKPLYSAPVFEPTIEAQWAETIEPDPVLLFRYSALTFNSHRIHYDRDWSVNKEGYPGLVVQGPLTATLLLNSLTQKLPNVEVSAFTFRGVCPLFDLAPFTLSGSMLEGEAKLWALTPDKQLAMTMDVVIA